MSRLLVLFVVAISLCGASVDFTFSTLYDINDFKNNAEVHITRCNYGCLIYASTMGDGFAGGATSDPYAANLLVNDNQNNQNYSITDLSHNFDKDSSQKLALVVAGPQASISVLNINGPNDFEYPIVLYVVEKTKASEFSYRVYDAVNMKGVSDDANSITTVMSAHPFNVVAQRLGAPNGVTARLTGFDNAIASNSDQCPEVFRMETENPFPGISLAVAGPIISFLKTERRSLKWDANIEFRTQFELATPGFITSAGYNGCKKPQSGGLQSFRSILLEKSDTYELYSGTNYYRVTMDVFPNLDNTHNVIITDVLPHDKRIVSGYGRQEIVFDNTQYIQVEFVNLSGAQGFLLKYSSEAPRTTPWTTVTAGPSQNGVSVTAVTQMFTTSHCQGITNSLLYIVASFAVARKL